MRFYLEHNLPSHKIFQLSTLAEQENRPYQLPFSSRWDVGTRCGDKSKFPSCWIKILCLGSAGIHSCTYSIYTNSCILKSTIVNKLKNNNIDVLTRSSGNNCQRQCILFLNGKWISGMVIQPLRYTQIKYEENEKQVLCRTNIHQKTNSNQYIPADPLCRS